MLNILENLEYKDLKNMCSTDKTIRMICEDNSNKLYKRLLERDFEIEINKKEIYEVLSNIFDVLKKKYNFYEDTYYFIMLAVIENDYFVIYKNIVKKSKDLSYIIKILDNLDLEERATDYVVELVKSKYFKTIFKNNGKYVVNGIYIKMIRYIDWERFQEILPKIKKNIPEILKRGAESPWQPIFRDNEDIKVLEYFIKYHTEDALKKINEIIIGLNENKGIKQEDKIRLVQMLENL